MVATEVVITLIKRYPVLYDPAFKNARKDDKVWNDIAAEILITGDALKRKWKNIKDTYAKYLRSLQSHQATTKNYRNWHWAEEMSFFRPYLNFVERISYKTSEIPMQPKIVSISSADIYKNDIKLDVDVDTNDDVYHIDDAIELSSDSSEFCPKIEQIFETSNEPQSSSPTHRNLEIAQEQSEHAFYPEINQVFENTTIDALEQKNSCSLKRKREHMEEAEENVVDTEKFVQCLLNKCKNMELDATEHLFLGYAKTVKTFTPRRQALTKMKIAQIIMEQELEHNEEMAQTNRQSWQS